MSGLKICPQCGVQYELDQRFCPQDGTTLRALTASADLVGAIVADRYHVLRKLGEGGMGHVYLAEHVKMGRQSALKVMNPGLVKDADAISRFNREAANASRINHPNVADVYDFGETPDGIIYLAMEFVDGPPLTKLLEAEGPLPPRRAATIIRQAAEALSAAHELGIVHRDLKPDNIMITRSRDGSDCVKIVDFGIAKAADNAAQKVTKTGLIVGTPEYMSPEQLAGDKLDGRSDIYALGLVAFNMLTGSLPFPADSAQESMIMRLTEPPRTLAEASSGVAWPADVQATIDKALQRDANARYQSAGEFGRALASALERMATAPQAIEASPEPASASGSIPVTRIGPDARGSGQRRPASALALPESIHRGGRRAVGIGAAAMILVTGLAGAALVYRRGATPPAVRDSVTPAGRPTSDVKTRDTARFAGQIDSTQLPLGASGGRVASVSGTTPTMADLARTLDSLQKVVERENVTPNEAGQVVRALEQMKHRIKGNEQLVQAALVEALAESSRQNNGAACASLRRVESIARRTSRAKAVSFALSQSC